MQDQSRNIPFIGRLEPRPTPTTTLDLRGKHRRIAELNRLEQEIKLLKRVSAASLNTIVQLMEAVKECTSRTWIIPRNSTLDQGASCLSKFTR